VADCGTNDVRDKISSFQHDLEKHLQKREIQYDQLKLLSDYYQSDDAGGNILKKFTQISSSLKISELKKYNTKHNTYSDTDNNKVENRFTLKFIQPVLTWAVVIHEAEIYNNENVNKKTIIIAGKDELEQWTYIFSFLEKIGGVFNIILKDDGEKTIFQEEKPMIFLSENEVESHLEDGNLARWLFEAFIATPNYPNALNNLQFCNECKRNPSCRDCLFSGNEDHLPDFVDKRKFVSSFWEIINPS
jgi:hypothetical protein